MFLAKVQGHVVATTKDIAINGQKLLIVEPMKVDYDADGSAADLSPTGRAIVAIDKLGSGVGQLVLIVQGSSARQANNCRELPIDAIVVGIVDEAVVMGKRLKV